MKDLKIKKLIDEEKKRQKKVINLIASENYVSKDVLEALGSELTNKYAEGYPYRRYYGGNEVVDKIESLAQERALIAFGLDKGKHVRKLDGKQGSVWAVNVQPLSGSPANLAVYTALVPKGGKIMGMNLSDGGHLTHGQKVSVTGKFWEPVSFGVDPKTEVIDYDALKMLAVAEKPALIVAGFTAYPRVVDWKKFRDIADACGAILMVDMSHLAGLIAGGAYPSPFEYADVVTTTVHKTLRGPRSALIFSRLDKVVKKEITKKDGTKAMTENTYADLIDKAVFPGLQGGPHINQVAAVAVALAEASTPAFKKYAKRVMKNARILAQELQKKGWRVVSGGTDSHLILIDTWMGGNKLTAEDAKAMGMSVTAAKLAAGAGAVTGKEASDRLEKVGIIVNKNTVPGEARSPFDPSGIRLGSAAETTRGRNEADFKKIAERIDKALRS